MAASGHARRIVHDRGIGACGRGRSARADPQRHGPLSSRLSGDRQRHAREPGSRSRRGASSTFPSRSMRSASGSSLTRPSWSTFSPRSTRAFGSTWSSRSASARWSSTTGTARSFGPARGWCSRRGPARHWNRRNLPPGARPSSRDRKLARTIALARAPAARRAAHRRHLRGVGPRQEERAHRARESLASKADGLPVEFLIGLPVPELVRPIGAPSLPTTIVLYLSQFRDRDGRPYTPREVLRAISGAVRCSRVRHRRNVRRASGWWRDLRNPMPNADA